MNSPLLVSLAVLTPALAMAAASARAVAASPQTSFDWTTQKRASTIALVVAVALLACRLSPMPMPALAALRTGGFRPTLGSAWMTVVVQLIGTVVVAFSARYLQGEPRQRRYAAALAAVLAAVHLMLLADHWIVLIAAWALVGVALEPLLCFYDDRPFALLASHKKFLTDRLADVLLVAAAALAWRGCGSGYFEALAGRGDALMDTPALHASGSLLVLAVIARTALLPVHGWLIQVMEAPTPVSALLHAGVVNLGGYVLLRLLPLWESASFARAVLVAAGVCTAVLAGLVSLTRVTIKVRLAWSTVAQMGFMMAELGLGWHTLAALHLAGHSLYKAHAFLGASQAVRRTRRLDLRGAWRPGVASLVAAPLVSSALIASVAAVVGTLWPWWWIATLGLAWAPLLWLPESREGDVRHPWAMASAGVFWVLSMALPAAIAHGVAGAAFDTPRSQLAMIAVAGFLLLYATSALVASRAPGLETWRRWNYAGFYLDDLHTRFTLRLWPARWTPGERLPAAVLPAARHESSLLVERTLP